MTRAYEGATLKKILRGRGVRPFHAGKEVEIRFYLGYSSSGYKSDYEHRETAWIELYHDNRLKWGGRYTGKNLQKAEREFVLAEKELRKHGEFKERFEAPAGCGL